MDVNSSECRAANNSLVAANITGLIFLAISVVFIILLCVLQHRVRLWRSCCWGHVGLPVPMDFLRSPRYRLPYILVFTILANELLDDIQSFATPGSIKEKVYLNIIYKILGLPVLVSIIILLKFFPLLACVDASNLFLGHCLGLIYSFLWFVNNLQSTIFHYYQLTCKSGKINGITVIVFGFQAFPALLITLSVVIWYTVQVLRTCYRCLQGKGLSPPGHDIQDYYLLRVKRLLSRSLHVRVTRGKMTQCFVKIGRYFFPYAKYHKLPLPFLCVVAAMSMFLYQLSMSMMILGFSLVNAGSNGYHNLLDALNLTDTTKDFFGGLFIGLPVVVVFSPLVALCLSGFLLLHMIGSISKLVKIYSREGFKEKLPSKLSIAPSAWRYLGSQFGYFVYAWVIYLLLSLVFGLAAVAIFYGFKYFTTYLVNLLLILVIPVIWTRLLFFAQLLICKFVFFEDSKGKFISITNRRLFNWFSLVLFLYNGFAGFVGAIIRVAFSAVVTLLLLFRLDTVVMAKGFEFLDFGHRAFLGFFYLHFCYNNAVVHTFIHLLKQEARGTPYHSPERRIQEEVSSPLLGSSSHRVYDRTPTTKHRRSHNRWLVAYTLIRNPQLQNLTAMNIAKSKMSMLSSYDAEDQVDVMGSRGRILTFETYPPLPKQAV